MHRLLRAQAPDAKTREKLAEEAKHGKFVAHAGSLPKAGRVAVQEAHEQGRSGTRSAKPMRPRRTTVPSSDFVANYTDPKTVKQLQAYIDATRAPVANCKQVVGAIVAVNGTVEAVDVFPIHAAIPETLAEAAQGPFPGRFCRGKQADAEKQATVDDARKFLRTAMEASVAKKSNSPGGLVVTKRESEKVMSFSAGMGGMGGGFGSPDAVHSSGYKKSEFVWLGRPIPNEIVVTKIRNDFAADAMPARPYLPANHTGSGGPSSSQPESSSRTGAGGYMRSTTSSFARMARTAKRPPSKKSASGSGFVFTAAISLLCQRHSSS